MPTILLTEKGAWALDDKQQKRNLVASESPDAAAMAALAGAKQLSIHQLLAILSSHFFPSSQLSWRVILSNIISGNDVPAYYLGDPTFCMARKALRAALECETKAILAMLGATDPPPWVVHHLILGTDNMERWMITAVDDLVARSIIQEPHRFYWRGLNLALEYRYLKIRDRKSLLLRATAFMDRDGITVYYADYIAVMEGKQVFICFPFGQIRLASADEILAEISTGGS